MNGLQAGFGLEPLHRLFQATRMHIGNHQGTAAFLGAAPGRRVADPGPRSGSNQYRLAGQQLVAGYIGWGLFHLGFS
ncbi:hypothetical protein D3C76_1640800 [compost metagenome]